MTALDYLVIGAYAVATLAIGRYYSKRTSNSDDYLLGGRKMNPFMIGVSLFAALTSTLSYLMLPGELIQHGPMIFAQLLSYPFSALVVGWFIIPVFMNQRVTSAYELLETRLGLEGRLLGAGMFVALRLIWMAAILYATAAMVVVPLLGFSSSAVPYACIAIAAITVVYTTEGGFQAVVITDALQSLIMVGGAVASIAVITIHLGGVSYWWPSTWYAHWDKPVLWDSSTAHVPLGGAFVNMLVWMICTCGSDQMAVQRYLATRDARSARRSLGISLCTNALVQMLLALTGLAVLAYFTVQSGPDNEVIRSADKLFPRFIVDGLPAGLTGLLIAALLSAAMSSASSGINSCCAVITTDFVDRFAPGRSGFDNVRLSRWVSLAIGIVIALLSILLGEYRGNLLEKSMAIVNLLTAPLFVLFFLSLFVPWSNSVGAYCATVASVTVAAGISFGGWFGVGFLWMGTYSLAMGILVGCIASLVPIVRKSAME